MYLEARTEAALLAARMETAIVQLRGRVRAGNALGAKVMGVGWGPNLIVPIRISNFGNYFQFNTFMAAVSPRKSKESPCIAGAKAAKKHVLWQHSFIRWVFKPGCHHENQHQHQACGYATICPYTCGR